MVLNDEIIALIKTSVKTAQLVGIDSLIIEEGRIRAIDDDKTVLIYQVDNVPKLPFESIGLNRVNVFTSRLNIVETRKNMTVEAIMNGDSVQSLLMKGDGTKVDYRCANSRTIRAPKNINKTGTIQFEYRIPLNPEAVMMMVKAQAAMGTDMVTIVSNESGVSFEMVDSTNDVFSFHFTDDVEFIGDKIDPSFVYRYPIKTLLSIFKQDTEACFEIANNGFLKYAVNGLDIILLPKV